jgi:hypothetical protein
MRWPFLCLATAALLGGGLAAQDMASVRLSNGFRCPVGGDGMKKYYKARGFRANGHLGEDWNGAGGGDTDLGDPVFCTSHGIVVFARDFRSGWGNVIIVRHVYVEGGETRFVDSLYGHLNAILVREGQQVKRGEKIGTIGSNHGMYDAHLHFEMRKDIRVGMHRNAFPRDSRTYWNPSEFIATRASLGSNGALAQVPINTFAPLNLPAYVGSVEATPIIRSTSVTRRPAFKVDRFGDLRQESN